MRERKDRGRKTILAVLLLLLVVITIGYAALSANLKVGGNSSIKGNKWDIHFENVKISKGSVKTESPATIDGSKQTITYTITLDKPGDYYEFTTDVVNAGTIDAKIGDNTNLIEPELTDKQKKYLNYVVTYENGNAISKGDLLKANDSKNVLVRVEYKKDIDNAELPNASDILNLKFNINYIQDDGNSYDIPSELNANNYKYTGSTQIFVAPKTGIYKLETWGSQGGSVDSIHGGYGAYSTGNISLNKGQKLFVIVGGKGSSGNSESLGGYNGGGVSLCSTSNSSSICGSGGGATHIASVDGTIDKLSDNLNDIYIIASAGGGSILSTQYESSSVGGNGGGIYGSLPSNWTNSRIHQSLGTKASQTSGGNFGLNYNSSYSGAVDDSKSIGLFGLGGSYAKSTFDTWVAGGGSGYYGGGAGYLSGGGGGSGYIGNASLNDKHMACYGCDTSDEESTKSINVSCVNESPLSDCAKMGDGFARILLIS